MQVEISVCGVLAIRAMAAPAPIAGHGHGLGHNQSAVAAMLTNTTVDDAGFLSLPEDPQDMSMYLLTAVILARPLPLELTMAPY